jgi:hypothetical protein
MDEPARILRRRNIEKTIFTLFIGTVLLIALVVAWQWPVRASIIVLVLGSIGIALSLVQIVADLKSMTAGAVRSQALDLEAPAFESSGRWGNLEIWLWIIGFLALIQLMGFLYAIPLFAFFYTKGYGGGWGLSVALAVCAWGFVYVVFDMVLHVPWPEPLIAFLKMQ